jgi:hypothetical protein
MSDKIDKISEMAITPSTVEFATEGLAVQTTIASNTITVTTDTVTYTPEQILADIEAGRMSITGEVYSQLSPADQMKAAEAQMDYVITENVKAVAEEELEKDLDDAAWYSGC